MSDGLRRILNNILTLSELLQFWATPAVSILVCPVSPYARCPQKSMHHSSIAYPVIFLVSTFLSFLWSFYFFPDYVHTYLYICDMHVSTFYSLLRSVKYVRKYVEYKRLQLCISNQDVHKYILHTTCKLIFTKSQHKHEIHLTPFRFYEKVVYSSYFLNKGRNQNWDNKK